MSDDLRTLICEGQRVADALSAAILDTWSARQRSDEPRLRDIVTMTAMAFDVRYAELISARRHAQTARARQVAMYLARELTGHSFPIIGRWFHRDHSTVMYAHQVVRQRLQTDAALAALVAALSDALSPTQLKEDAHV